MYETGKGWDGIVDYLVLRAKENDAHILQVKEKFGGLRFYVDPPEKFRSDAHRADYDRFVGEIEVIEQLSLHLCEECGRPGTQDNPRGWIKTLCPDHTEKPA